MASDFNACDCHSARYWPTDASYISVNGWEKAAATLWSGHREGGGKIAVFDTKSVLMPPLATRSGRSRHGGMETHPIDNSKRHSGSPSWQRKGAKSAVFDAKKVLMQPLATPVGGSELGAVKPKNIRAKSKRTSNSKRDVATADTVAPHFSKARPLAESVGVCPKTVHRWARAGLIHPRKVGARTVLYDRREVLAFIESTRVASV